MKMSETATFLTNSRVILSILSALCTSDLRGEISKVLKFWSSLEHLKKGFAKIFHKSLTLNEYDVPRQLNI